MLPIGLPYKKACWMAWRWTKKGVYNCR